MTKDEILTLAGRVLGDTSAGFKADVLEPFFQLVLLDLANYQCIEPVRRSADFNVISGQRGYSLKEITKQTPHPVMKVESLTVFEWGRSYGQIPIVNYDRFIQQRLDDGETATGKWKMARIFPNSDNLEVTPPAGDDEAFDADTGAPIVAQLFYVAHPRSYGPDDDITEIHAEDIPVVISGLVKMGAPFGDDTLNALPAEMMDYEAGKREMWARRWNNRAGRVTPEAE